MQVTVTWQEVLLSESAGLDIAHGPCSIAIDQLELLMRCNDQCLGLVRLTSPQKFAQALPRRDSLPLRQVLVVNQTLNLQLSDAVLALLVHLIELVQ